MKNFSHDSILDGVHYMRSHSYIDLIAAVHILPDFIVAHPKVSEAIVKQDCLKIYWLHTRDTQVFSDIDVCLSKETLTLKSQEA